MRNGTSQAILVRELFVGDGPHGRIAEDFVAQRCSRCGVPTADDVRFHDHGYLCSGCWTALAGA
jgi:hypothetical protein